MADDQIKKKASADTTMIRRLPEEPDIHIILKANYRYVTCLRDMCERLAVRAGFGEEDTFSIKLAFDEVLTNAFMHGCNHPSDDKIEVKLSLVEGGIYARIRDPGGKPFDYRKYKDPSRTTADIIGRGLTLVNEFTDGWTVVIEEGKYTEVMFYKKKSTKKES